MHHKIEEHSRSSIRGTRVNRKDTRTMKYLIDMRTLTVVGIELDDTNVNDRKVLMNIETKTGRILSVAVKETLLNEEVDY